MSAAEIIIDCKFNETARTFAETHGYGGGFFGECGMYEMQDSTVARGFGLIEINGADDLLTSDPGDHFYGHECERIRRRVNAETAKAEFDAIGVQCWDWRGFVAFDASSPRGRALADQIGGALADYPVLDDERVSELEWDAARTVIEQAISLPDGVDADDVLREMPETRYCGQCGTSGIEDAMQALGYRECAECEEWIKSSLDGAMCHDCAESEAEPECDCVPVYIDTMRHNGTYATRRDVNEILRGCESCYYAMHPYGLSA
ncbi:hypothetical protein [Streptomyces noursei]|uniref:hypothetical protein n=1 Tax=Streptomyces noursei TaxID=1971 RepID=UPI0016720089|nr:hypothetical protein [Streptomyces noursei]MCZ1021088.1 hypothetical protein [Streptomyces noursei]GGX51626.1 hypothetical protein GCM10010341_86420 [Streptomyces noursei]